MHRLAYSGCLAGLAFMTAGVNAQEVAPAGGGASPAGTQEASPSVLCVADPPNPQPAEATPQADAAKKEVEQKPEKPSVAKDVGSAVGGTAGQIAGAAVAGPIGAAAGGVVVERVGRAVVGLVKGDKKKDRKAAAQAAPAAPAKCVAETPATAPEG